MADNQQRNLFRFVTVLLPILVYSLFRFSVGPLLPSLQDTFSIPVSVSGALVSASTLSVGIGTGLSGYFVSKFSGARTVFFGLVIFSISLGASVIIRNFALFATLFVISGLGAGLMTTPTYPMAATMIPKRKGLAIGLMSATYNLGGFVGPTLSGILLNYAGWQYPFFAMGLIGIIFSLIFRSNLSGFSTPLKKDTSSTLTSGFRKLVSNKNILVLAFSMLLADFGFFCYATYTVQYFGDRFNLNQSALVPIDFYFGVAVGVGAFGVIVFGFIYDRFGGKTAAVLSGSAMSICSFALYTSANLVSAILSLFVAGFIINSFWSILSTAAQANAPEYSSAASAVSFVQTFAFVGAVLGLAIAALLFGNAVTTGPLLITVTVPFVLFTMMILIFYKTARSTRVLSK